MKSGAVWMTCEWDNQKMDVMSQMRPNVISYEFIAKTQLSDVECVIKYRWVLFTPSYSTTVTLVWMWTGSNPWSDVRFKGAHWMCQCLYIVLMPAPLAPENAFKECDGTVTELLQLKMNLNALVAYRYTSKYKYQIWWWRSVFSSSPTLLS